MDFDAVYADNEFFSRALNCAIVSSIKNKFKIIYLSGC